MRGLALCSLAAPLALAACGGGTSNASSDPLTAVQQAGQKTARTSYRATGMQNFSNASATFAGNYTSSPTQGVVAGSTSIYGHPMKFAAVVSGTKVYEKYSDGGTGQSWLMVDFAKHPILSSVDPVMLVALSPVQALQALQAAGTVTDVGTQTIDGASTTHYRVSGVDTSKLPPGASPAVLSRPTYGPINVWIGTADGYVHRESLGITDSSAPLTLKMAVNFSKFGDVVHVSVPAASATNDVTKGG